MRDTRGSFRILFSKLTLDHPAMRRLIIPTVILSMFAGLHLRPTVDDDNDGMPDAWETTYGLDTGVDDAMDDFDGDGIPNIYEYIHGSDPSDANSVPAAHRRVDPSDVGAYATIQAAISAASPYDIISIAPGTYAGTGNRSLSSGSKSVLLVGDGGSDAVIIDLEGNSGFSASGGDVGVVGITFHRPSSSAPQLNSGRFFVNDVRVRQGTSSQSLATFYYARGWISQLHIENGANAGLYLYDTEAVVDRFTYTGNRTTSSSGAIYAAAGSRLLMTNSIINDNRGVGQLLYFGSSSTQIELLNTVLLRNRLNYGYTIQNGSGSTVALNHVTYADNRIDSSGYTHVYNSGTLSAQNSIFYNQVEYAEFGGNAPTLVHALVRGGATGTSILNADPKLAYSGHLLHDSPAIDAGLTLGGADYDRDGESRTADTAPDLGADEWVADGTHAQLPAWFVTLHGLAASTGDADGDGLSDADEYLHGTNPTIADTDGDGLSDFTEVSTGLNPLSTDTDGDGMADGWEVTYGLNPLIDDAFGDADGDGFPNLFEYINNTDPTDSLSKPSAHRRVDPSDVGAHATFQAAITAASPYDIIAIAPGTYTGSGNRGLSVGSKPLLFVGEGGSDSVIMDLTGGYGGLSASSTDLAVTGIRFLNAGSSAVQVSTGRVGLHDIVIGAATSGWGVQLSNATGAIHGLSIQEGLGGGISASSSRIRITNFNYIGNRPVSSSYRAVEAASASDLFIAGALITDNRVYQDLINLYSTGTRLDLVNALMMRNQLQYGSVIRNGSSVVTQLDHVTVAANRTINSGYTYISNSGALSARNSIFYNIPGMSEFSGTVTLSHAIVRGGAGGTAVLDADPKLSYSGHLRHDSPAIDAGTTIAGLDWDIDEEARPEGFSPDLGADEWVADATHPQLPAWYVALHGLGASTGDSDGDGLSDQDEYLHGTNPNASDSDGDGLTDADEIVRGTHPLHVDTDEDGMPDGWEVTHGLDPLVDDAFGDLDRDGIPNVFEFLKNTDPTDVNSVPAASRRVDPTGAGGAHLTIQAAINAAVNYDIIDIAAGTYSGSGNRSLSISNKRLLFRGEGGSSAVVLDLQRDYGGFSSSSDLAVSGIGFLRPSSSAISASNNRLLLHDIHVREGWSQTSSAIYLSNVRGRLDGVIVEEGRLGGISSSSSNLTIRDYTYRYNNTYSSDGALRADSSTVVIHGFRAVDNSSRYTLAQWNYGTLDALNMVILRNNASQGHLLSYQYGTGAFRHVTAAANKVNSGYVYLSRVSGTLTAENVIFHNELGASEFSGTTPSLSHAIVRGGASGTAVIDADPLLTHGGHLRHDSPAIDSGLLIAGIEADIDGETRPEGTAPDIGADEWVADATHAQLPAWFVSLYGLGASTGDADGDGLSDFDEYLAGTDPSLADTDGDGLSDSVEITAGTDPRRSDTDRDGMPDGWEIANGLDPLKDDAMGDADGDGYPNLFEYIYATSADDDMSRPTADYVVDIGGLGDFTRLYDAVSEASYYGGEFTIIEVAPGTYVDDYGFSVGSDRKRVLLISRDGPETTIIDGLSIYGGLAPTALYVQGGSGVSGFTIKRFAEAVLYLQGSENRSYLDNLRLRELGDPANSYWGAATALYFTGAGASVHNVLVEDVYGYGIYSGASLVEMRNVRLSEGFGGYAINQQSGTLRLDAVDITDWENISGGLFSAQPLIRFVGTQAEWRGGMVSRSASAGTQPLVQSQGVFSGENLLFTHNQSGGGLWWESGSGATTLAFSTFWKNTNHHPSHTVFRRSSPLSLDHVILWNESATAELPVSGVTAEYSFIRDGYAGTGNSADDPALTPDGRITLVSPARAAGLTGSAPDFDYEGDPRPSGSPPDVGADQYYDSDANGLPDSWELQHFGALGNDPNDDPDGDTLVNLDEFLLGTDPMLADTDGDYLPDGVEVHLYGSDPLVADAHLVLVDLNGDGIPDGPGAQLGIDPTNHDHDGDGISNEDELRLGLDPFNADTDGDGVNDGIDIYPTDPTRHSLPPPDVGDTTAPVITLTAPSDAVLLP